MITKAMLESRFIAAGKFARRVGIDTDGWTLEYGPAKVGWRITFNNGHFRSILVDGFDCYLGYSRQQAWDSLGYMILGWRFVIAANDKKEIKS